MSADPCSIHNTLQLRQVQRGGHLLASLGAILLGLGAAWPAAQSPDYSKALGKDDEAFARALSRAGYSDLAELVLGALEKGGSASGSLSSAMIRLELEQDAARREADVNVRIQKLEELIAAREEFAKKHQGTAEATDILNGQLELYRSVGELIIQALQKEDTPEPEKLQKRGVQILEKAVAELEQQLAALQKEELDAESFTPERQQEHFLQKMLASYGLARTHYFRALLYPPESHQRETLARKSLGILLDFQLEYPDQLLCFEGFIYEGLAHESINENEKAFESFDASIALRETYEKARSGIYEMAPEAADIVSSAVQQKMLLQAKLGDHAGAAATAADFLSSTKEPWTALKGLAVMSLQAEAFQALGDQEALTKVAKLLVEVDPHGPGGLRGRELLGEGAGSTNLGAAEMLRLAETAAGKEPERAIELCQRVMILARGTNEQADLGSRAGLLLGALYAQRNALHESVVAWEGAAQRYPDGKDAPECLWRAINGYLALQGQERRAIYKTIAQEHLSELSKRYPQHQYAAMAGLIEGQQAEAEQDFARAAMVYERIAPGSAGHEEGLYRAGNAWSREARKLFGEGKEKEAKDAVQRADSLLVKAREALEKAAEDTLETSVQDRMRGLAFNARLAQADLYLLEGVDRGADVAALLQGMDQELSKDPVRMAAVRDRRFRALRSQDKLDEAMALLDSQIHLDPKAAWVESGAGTLAPILDTRGQEIARKDPTSSEINRLWGRAATYYQLAIRGQLEGSSAIEIDQLEGVADRLFVFGLHLEGVPETVETFAEWDGKRLTNELLESAAQAYEAVLPLTPSHRTVIKLGRTLGFLGRWEDAAARYAELFEREQFIHRATNTINQELVQAKPELLFAYLEWGVAERHVGNETKDSSKQLRAQRIFEAIVLGSKEGSKLWWQAKFHQMQTMLDLGQYEIADVALASIELSYPSFDEGQYGLQRAFTEMRGELSQKVPK